MSTFDPDAFAAAWNSHDIDQLMAMSSEDCIFLASAGPAPGGTMYSGQMAVRAAYLALFKAFPDGQWTNSRATAIGENRVLVEWQFSATKSDGQPMLVDGLDILDITAGKVRVKNSYRKSIISG